MNRLLIKSRAALFESYGKAYFQVAGWSEEDEKSGLSLDKAFEMHNSGVSFVDVRRPREWRRGSIKRALFATGAEFDHVSPKPPFDEPIVAFCEAGDRARNAARALRKQGYSQVYFLWPGGYSSWLEAGYPTVS